MKTLTPAVSVRTVVSRLSRRFLIIGLIAGLISLPFLGVNFWGGIWALVGAAIGAGVLFVQKMNGQALGVWHIDPKAHKQAQVHGKLLAGYVTDVKKDHDDKLTYYVTATVRAQLTPKKVLETSVRLRLNSDEAKMWQPGSIKAFRYHTLYPGALIHVTAPDNWTKKDIVAAKKLAKVAPTVQYSGVITQPTGKKYTLTKLIFAILCFALGLSIGLLPVSQTINRFAVDTAVSLESSAKGVSFFKQSWLEKGLKAIEHSTDSGKISFVYVNNKSVRASVLKNDQWRDVEYRYDKVQDVGASLEQPSDNDLTFAFEDLDAAALTTTINKTRERLNNRADSDKFYAQVFVEQQTDQPSTLFVKTYLSGGADVQWVKNDLNGKIIETSKN